MKITLKDNVVAEVSKGTTVASVVECISQSLAKNAICGKINGKLVDLQSSISKNCKLEIITMKDKDAINVLWHSSSHILAQAVKTIYPNAKLACGQNDENGFYYDFDFKTPISESDFSLIEDEMQKIIDADFTVVRTNITKQQAFMIAEENEEPYKLELINSLTDGESYALYSQGDFSDFCSGPHLKSTGLVKAFKLTRLEKTFWNNDVNSKPLTRIYGVSFFYKKDLDHYIKNREIIAKRNHLVIGKSLSFFDKDTVTGEIILLPQGQRIMNSVWDYSRSLAEKYGHHEISLLGGNYRDTNILPVSAYRLTNKKSLMFPLRYVVGENHVSSTNFSENNGLIGSKTVTRHRFITFVPAVNIDAEFKQMADVVKEFYAPFGYAVTVRMSVSDFNMSPEYAKVKSTLKRVLEKKFGVVSYNQSGFNKVDVIKIEYVISDCLGREWTIGNCYIDFGFAQKEKIATEVGGKLCFPITIVNNICLSTEKLFAILIEHYAGDLPYWLKATLVKIVATSDRAIIKGKKIITNLRKYGVYAELYLSKKESFKPDEYVPYTIALGEDEVANNKVKLVMSGEKTLSVPVKKFMQEIIAAKMSKEIEGPKKFS